MVSGMEHQHVAFAAEGQEEEGRHEKKEGKMGEKKRSKKRRNKRTRGSFSFFGHLSRGQRSVPRRRHNGHERINSLPLPHRVANLSPLFMFLALLLALIFVFFQFASASYSSHLPFSPPALVQMGRIHHTSPRGISLTGWKGGKKREEEREKERRGIGVGNKEKEQKHKAHPDTPCV